MAQPKADSEGALRKLLTSAKAERELLAIYPYPDEPEAMLVGQVLTVGENSAQFQLIGILGEPEGKEEFPFRDILRVERDTDYLNGLTRCLESPDWKDLDVGAQREIDRPSDFPAALAAANKGGFPISLTLVDEEEVEGFVESIEGPWVLIEPLADGGLTDGLLLCRISQIERIETGTDELRRSWHEYKTR